MQKKQVKLGYSPEIGKAKSELFKQAFKRVDRAISLGFHLEAITLIESLICDRIETIFSIYSNTEVSPSTLGPLIKKLTQLELVEQNLIIELNDWRQRRNLVLHQMVKITHPESINWRARMIFARETAIDGRELLKLVQGLLREVKKGMQNPRI